MTKKSKAKTSAKKAPRPRAGKKPVTKKTGKPSAIKMMPGETDLRTQQPRIDPKKIIIGKRFRKDFGDIEATAASINARGGLIQPVALNPRGELIAGERRLKAWKRSQFASDPIPFYVLDVDSILAGEWDENAVRKDFTPSEAVEIQRAMEPIERAKAKERQREHGGTAPGKKNAAGGNKAPVRAADQVARLTGMDRKTLAKAAAVVDAAAADPEKFGKIQEDMDRTGNVSGPHKRMSVLQQTAEIRKEKPGLPMRGPYRVLVVDFPWPSEPADEKPADRGRGYYPYPTMSIEEGKAMAPEIDKILAADAWIWFWVPNFHAANGLHAEILKAWGLEPITIRTWAKNKIGQGQVLRGQTELCVLAKRGKPIINLTNETTLMPGKVRGHSEKPENFYADVEKLCPAPRYAELFSRRALPDNWDGHGDQVGKLAPGAKIPPAVARQLEAELLAQTILAARSEPLGDILAEALAVIDAGGVVETKDTLAKLLKSKYIIGKGKIRVSGLGKRYLDDVRANVAAAAAKLEPTPLERAIADAPRTGSLTNPKHMPSPEAVKAAADRAERPRARK